MNPFLIKKIMFIKSTSLLTLALSLVLVILPIVASAQNNNPANNPPATYTLLEPLPCIGNGSSSDCATGNQIKTVDFQSYIQYVFNLLIAMAAVAAVFMIVWGGFQYMSSDAYSGKKEGLSKLQNAIYGLLLILCSYLILQTIDPRLVNIPTTLVKPLDIKYRPDEISNFFDLLSKEANTYRKSAVESKQVISFAQKKVTDLEAQKKSLNDSLDLLTTAGGALSDTDPRVKMLKAQIANIENQIRSEQASVLANNRILSMQNVGMVEFNGVENSSPSGTILGSLVYNEKEDYQNHITELINTVNSQYQTGVSELTNLGVETPQSMKDTRTLVVGQLLINKLLQSPYLTVSTVQDHVDSIEGIVKNANIVDPSIKSRLSDTAQSAVDKLKTDYAEWFKK